MSTTDLRTTKSKIITRGRKAIMNSVTETSAIGVMTELTTMVTGIGSAPIESPTQTTAVEKHSTEVTEAIPHSKTVVISKQHYTSIGLH